MAPGKSSVTVPSFVEALLEHIPSPSLVRDVASGTYIYANTSARQMFGVTGDLSAVTDQALFGSNTQALAELDEDLAKDPSHTRTAELEIQTTSGPRWLIFEKSLLTETNGAPLILTVAEDMDAAVAQRTTETGWHDVFEHAEWGIAVDSGGPGGLRLVNQAFATLHGYTVEELTGRDALELIVPDHRDAVSARFAAAAEAGHQTFESHHQRKDGSTFWALMNITVTRDDAAEIRTRAINVLNITPYKEARERLVGARVEAELANQAKGEFLARMSHELRTPLNVILGFAQVLQLDELSESQKENVDHILTAGRHLLALIDEVLDITRVESGAMPLTLEPVDLNAAAAEVLRLMAPLAAEKNVTLRQETRPDAPAAQADRAHLHQVLMNLVSNGIKYNVEGGEVVVGCRAVNGMVELSVTDTGIGIPPERFSQLFVPFERLGHELSDIDGTGLGLSLSRALLHAMHGDLSAGPGPDRGTTFVVSLPQAGDTPVSATEDESPNGKVVLYLEDNLTNLGVVEQVLRRRRGVSVLSAMQGGLGLELARNHQPDMVVLDLYLPDIPGPEVLRRLKTSVATRDIPVVVAGSGLTPEQEAQLLGMGAVAYVTKPIDVHRFLQLIDQHLAVPDAGR